MVYNILVFLNESPLTIFAGTPYNSAEWSQAFEDGFTSFMGFLAADDVRIRHLTNSVMCKLINDGCVALWRKSQSPGPQNFNGRFWKST
jgi:neurofibromin 1